MPTSHPRVLAAALLLLAAAGCAHRPAAPALPPLEPPRLTIDAVVPGALDAFGVTVVVRGHMENPNPVDLPVTGFDFSVLVDGRPADAGRVDQRQVLPAGGTAAFDVPARLHWTRVPELAVVLSTRRTLALRVTGAVRLQGAAPLPWGADATVALPYLPQLALVESRVRESNVMHTTAEFELRVRNPNDFPLPVGHLQFDLLVSGAVVANAQSHALDQVPAHGEVTVLIPVRFSPLGTVKAAVGGVFRLQANVRLKGRAGWGELEVAVDEKVGL
jgi:LEA14-like dessication related protein